MASTAARVLLAIAALVSSHAQAQDIEISCDGSPSDATTTVPTPADRFVHVLCTKYGHVLTPVAGWFWTPPGTFSPTFYPAQMVQADPKEVGNSVYFKSIAVTQLEGREAAHSWQVIGRMFGDPPPSKALRIVAASSGGSQHTILIFPNSWGYSCSPSCSQDSAFVMVSQNKQPPSW